MSLLFEMSCHLKIDDQSGDKYSDCDWLLAERDFEKSLITEKPMAMIGFN